MKKYSNKFFDNQREGSLLSAQEIVPLIIKYTTPKSVVDVGCGTGAWLSVFLELGVKKILGIDGAYLDRKKLYIPEHNFLVRDIGGELLREEKFDLVISTEVAEHIPGEKSDKFIDSLVSLGSVILFSAAIPGQGGVNHFNEQWPEYWVDKFRERGYVVVDCLRKKIWNNENVKWWYAQNLLFFVRETELDKYPLLKAEAEKTDLNQLSIVHPKKYLLAVNGISGRRLIKRIFGIK